MIMKLKVKTLPTFATDASRICTLRADEPFGGLTLEEAEKVVKTWFYETLLEVKEPDECKILFFTRTTASKQLNIAPETLDGLIKKMGIEYHWLGNRKILYQSDLNRLITDKNIYNDGKS